MAERRSELEYTREANESRVRVNGWNRCHDCSKLNLGVGLASRVYLKPIQEQLKTKSPVLTPAERNHYNKVCQPVVKFGANAVWKLYWKKGPDIKLEDLKSIVIRIYAWAND